MECEIVSSLHTLSAFVWLHRNKILTGTLIRQSTKFLIDPIERSQINRIQKKKNVDTRNQLQYIRNGLSN